MADPAGALPAIYHAARRRITALAGDLTPAQQRTVVPACPDWTAHELVAHVVGIPEALTSGNLPTGDMDEWLDSLVIERREVPVVQLLTRWEACAEATTALLASSGVNLLCIDVVVHEHDLRGALDRPGARDAPEVAGVIPMLLGLLQPGIAERGLPPLAVDSGSGRWSSAEGEPGFTLTTDAWTAVPALESRRTAEELRALPGIGDITPYIDVVAAHSPLPARPLPEQ